MKSNSIMLMLFFIVKNRLLCEQGNGVRGDLGARGEGVLVAWGEVGSWWSAWDQCGGKFATVHRESPPQVRASLIYWICLPFSTCVNVCNCIRWDGWCCWCRLCKYVTWSVGCLWGGLSSKGRTVDSQPGTRVDGYTHNYQKKRDLQVSKQGDGLCKRNWMAKGGQEVSRQKEMLLYVYACIHSVVHTLSANNSALCLGYK